MSDLRIADASGVRTLTLDGVDVRKALTVELRRELPEALAAADANPVPAEPPSRR